MHPEESNRSSVVGTPSPAATPPVVRRGNPLGLLLAWLVILACSGYAVWEANRSLFTGQPAPVAASQPTLGNPDQPLDGPLEAAGRVMVGLGELVAPDMRSSVLTQAAMLQGEGPKERMVYAIIAADLVGLEQASKELDALAEDSKRDASAALSATDERLLAILQRLYATDSDGRAAAEALSDDDRTFLDVHLRWFGRFAPLARGVSGESPQRAAMLQSVKRGPVAVLAFVAWLLVCGAVGMVALIVLLVMGLTQRLRHGFAYQSGRGWLYAEAFAVWLGLFLALSVLVDWLMRSPSSQPHVTLPDALALLPSMLIQIACFIAALGWAAMRVGSFRTVREDIGLHAGRGIFKEVAAGALTYCAALPMLMVGLILTMVLLAVQEWFVADAPPPSHPVQHMLMNAGWVSIVLTLVLGAVIAPIVEETAFRGMFYRHLRDATGSTGLVVSFLISGGVSSLVFAMIHPQGWAVIPALASLALAFSLAREWRGSLIPGMVAHGISNFVVMGVSIMLFRG
jgi:membrane protease YdiL (CAAX protease family)